MIELQKAPGLASELEYMLLLARDLGHLTEANHEQLVETTVQVRKMLSGLIRKL